MVAVECEIDIIIESFCLFVCLLLLLRPRLIKEMPLANLALRIPLAAVWAVVGKEGSRAGTRAEAGSSADTGTESHAGGGGGSAGTGERSDPSCTLKTEPAGFPDGVNVRGEAEQEIKNTLHRQYGGNLKR